MRKTILASVATTTALALAACSPAAEQAPTEDVAVETEESAVVEETAGVLDANAATADELAGVEGVTPELADAIVAGQPFASITDFNAVLMANLGEDEAAAIRESVFVPVNLNTATSEELALIPGIDDRMIHEFEEYVPYADMAEFDREIGKYVDEEEVARYRQYVTL